MKNEHLFRPRLESLEDRKLMAGDVQAALEGSLLIVEGDALDNQLAITQTASGDVILSGQNGTTINGLPSVRFLRPQLNAMEVLLHDGNDSIAFRGVQVANDLYVDLGSGNDRLTSSIASPMFVGANASIYGSAGNDSVQLAGAWIQEDLIVDGGLGVLQASMSTMTINKGMSVIGDEANDSVVITNLSVAQGIHIETKGGSDRVSMTDLMGFTISIQTDSNAAIGADQVLLTRVSVIEDIGIFTGMGNDVVRLTDVSSGKLSVSLDEGNDRLVATRVAVATDAVFEGGAGSDIFENFGVSAGIFFDLKEFETLRP